jgi:prepilin-type N-terminal cleavage/methylation domain-containing protein
MYLRGLFMKKYAFTLAEVLITLGIIGVVAAMTIPTLLQKHKERVTITKVKTTYSKLSQALRFAIAENGEVNGWDYYPEDTEKGARSFFEYLKPYLKLAYDCGAKRTNICSIVNLYKLNDTYHGGYNGSKYYEFILNDGTKLWFRIIEGKEACTQPDRYTENVCAMFWLDVDSKNSKNILGKDVFTFYVIKNGIIPDEGGCSLDSDGWGCTKYILKNGNMDYLHK